MHDSFKLHNYFCFSKLRFYIFFIRRTRIDQLMRCYNNFEICEQSARLRYHINCFLFGPENSNLCSIYKWIPQAKPGWFPKDESLKGISSSVQHPVNYVVIILLRSTEAFTLCYWGPSYLLHPWKRRKLKNAKMGGKSNNMW